MARFGEEVLGKGIVYGKDTDQLHRQPHRHLRDDADASREMQKAELTVEEVDKIFGPAMGRPKSAVFRTADIVGLDTFVHVAKNCYDTLTQDEERETFRVARLPREDGRRRGCWATRAAAASTRRSRARTARRRSWRSTWRRSSTGRRQKVRFESLGAAKDVEDVRERIATVMNGTDKAAQVRRAGDAGRAGLRQPPHPGDRRRPRQHRPRRCAGASRWDLGPFETWDAYGVQKGVERMKELGLKPAAWVEEMLAAGPHAFYGVEDGTRHLLGHPAASP